MKRGLRPNLANRVVLANGRDSLIVAIDLYQPEEKQGRFTVDTDRRKGVTVAWRDGAWRDIDFKDESEKGKSACTSDSGGAGSNPASSRKINYADTQAKSERSRSRGHKPTGSFRTSRVTSENRVPFKEVPMPAPAAVTRSSCPPPARKRESPPGASHPFRNSFSGRHKRAVGPAPPDAVDTPDGNAEPPSASSQAPAIVSDEPDVVTRIPDGYACEADAPLRACRVCGCTDDDCSQCVEKTGSPCWWVAADLCSACQTFPAVTHSSAHVFRSRDLAARSL